MQRALAIAAFTLLAGCNAMTNDEIIAETQKCEAAGLRAVYISNNTIQCRPKPACTDERVRR